MPPPCCATSIWAHTALGHEPQPDPPIPPEVRANIIQLISTEVQNQQMAGAPVDSDQAHMRYISLLHAAQQAARRNADTQADAASDKIEDILVAGRFIRHWASSCST